MVTGLIGKKVGMTQLFAPDGRVHPATVLKAGPCVVSQVKTAEKDGYQAVQLGLVEAKAHKENKPTEGHFKKAGVPPTRVRREVRVRAGGEAHGRPHRRSGPAAHALRALDGAAVAARGQEVARAVRDPDAQAPHRHLRADAPNRRRPDEAGSAGRRGRGDQGVREGT